MLMNLNEVLAEEIKKISVPSAEVSRLKKIANDFIEALEKKGLVAQIGGSLAKGTLVVKEKQDIDIFVVFNYSEDIVKLEKVLSSVKLPGKLKRVHGSRDYFQIDCKDVLLEVVPVVDNKDPNLAENVTDVSLSHVKYISREVKKNPAIADEIKLAKVFCRANSCYGAESYIRGFSGYSLEVLVIYFGGFVKFLKGIQKKSVIDPLKYFKNEREVMMELNSSKLKSPIVLVDPTYKFRNVCAGLGLESFERFVDVVEKFLKKPSLDFFEKKEIDVNEIKNFARSKRAKFVEVNLKTNRQDGDIAGTKMKKLLDFFVRELVRKKQKVLRKEFDYSGKGKGAKGYLVIEEVFEIEVRGPSVGLQDAVKAFRKAKGNKVFEGRGFWWFRERVSVESVLEFVKSVEKDMGAEIEIV